MKVIRVRQVAYRRKVFADIVDEDALVVILCLQGFVVIGLCVLLLQHELTGKLFLVLLLAETVAKVEEDIVKSQNKQTCQQQRAHIQGHIDDNGGVGQNEQKEHCPQGEAGQKHSRRRGVLLGYLAKQPTIAPVHQLAGETEGQKACQERSGLLH